MVDDGEMCDDHASDAKIAVDEDAVLQQIPSLFPDTVTWTRTPEGEVDDSDAPAPTSRLTSVFERTAEEARVVEREGDGFSCKSGPELRVPGRLRLSIGDEDVTATLRGALYGAADGTVHVGRFDGRAELSDAWASRGRVALEDAGLGAARWHVELSGDIPGYPFLLTVRASAPDGLGRSWVDGWRSDVEVP